jgi:hypothetical protein
MRVLRSLFLVFGAGCFTVVVLTHVCEADHLFPSMGWGLQHSPGHYFELCSAVLGLIFFPLGFLLRILRRRDQDAAACAKISPQQGR